MQKKTKANKVLCNTYKQLSCFFRSHFRMTSSLSIQTFGSSMNHRSFRINFRVQIISCGQRSLFQGWTTGTGLDFSAWISTQFGRDFFTDGRIWGSFWGPEFGILRVLDGGEGSHVILHVDGGGHRFKIKRPFFFSLSCSPRMTSIFLTEESRVAGKLLFWSCRVTRWYLNFLAFSAKISIKAEHCGKQ